mmetsp:Transcript_26357/g.62651  ORF Transcript_26357/g.62651 Transcript_26357/m.62651 type:complete len:119 (-) Transcript_26357:1151-1507(-)
MPLMLQCCAGRRPIRSHCAGQELKESQRAIQTMHARLHQASERVIAAEKRQDELEAETVELKQALEAARTAGGSLNESLESLNKNLIQFQDRARVAEALCSHLEAENTEQKTVRRPAS